MNFFALIREWVIWLTQVLVDAALWCYDVGWPLEGLGDFFVWLSDATSEIQGDLWAASKWWTKIELVIEDILSWAYIKLLIRSWLIGIEDALEWFNDWWNKVKEKVEEWWEATLVTVKGWIDIASEFLEELIDQLQRGFASLQETWDTFITTTFKALSDAFDTLTTAWDTFTTTVLLTLAKLTDVDDLIISKLKEWFPFYDDLVSLWEEIKAFFADPLQWMYDKLDEFFERFW